MTPTHDHPLILLSGGKGSCAGMSKGLVPVAGRPWLEHQLEAFARAGGKKAVVILGYQVAGYVTAMPWLKAPLDDPGYGSAEFAGLEVVAAVSGTPELGVFSSIQLGGFLLSGNGHLGAFLMPVDVPAPAAEVWESLNEAHSDGALVAIPTFDGKNGHPVLLSMKTLESFVGLESSSPDARMDRQFMRVPAEKLVRIPVMDARVRICLETLEDWKALFPN